MKISCADRRERSNTGKYHAPIDETGKIKENIMSRSTRPVKYRKISCADRRDQSNIGKYYAPTTKPVKYRTTSCADRRDRSNKGKHHAPSTIYSGILEPLLSLRYHSMILLRVIEVVPSIFSSQILGIPLRSTQTDR